MKEIIYFRIYDFFMRIIFNNQDNQCQVYDNIRVNAKCNIFFDVKSMIIKQLNSKMEL